MQDTLLANVGCLAVFQVAASDARQLIGELDRERVTEEDLVSLPVHHCYVRATVDGERMATYSMKVRRPEDGDPCGGGARPGRSGGLHHSFGDHRLPGRRGPAAGAGVPGQAGGN